MNDDRFDEPNRRPDPAGQHRDAYDTAIQVVFGVALQLEACAGMLETEPERVRQQLTAVVGRLNGLIADMRDRIYGLDPPQAPSGLDRAACDSSNQHGLP